MADDPAQPTDATPPSKKKRSDPRPKWARMHFWQIQPVRDLLVIALIFTVFYLGYVVSVVTVPLLLALLLAYLLEPVTQWVTRSTRLKRRGAVISMMVATIIAVGIPVVIGGVVGTVQTVRLVDRLANNAAKVRASVENPDDQRRAEAVPEGAWSWLRDHLIEIRTQMEARDAEQLLEALPPETPESGASQDGVSEDATPEGSTPDAAPAEERSPEDGETEQPATADGENADTGTETAADTPNDTATTEPEDNPEPEARQRERVDGAAISVVLRWFESNGDALTSGLVRTGANAVEAVLAFASGLFGLAFTSFLTLFFYYFIATGWPRVLNFGQSLLPDAETPRIIDLLRQMDRVISGFVRGRFTIAIILSVWFSIGYWIAGVPAPLIVGIVTGILSVAPYMALIMLPVSVILLWLQGYTNYRGEIWWVLLAPFVVYQIGQLADDYLLTPSIQGKETDLDMPTILFAVIAGGALAGVYGLLIAIPLAACIKILIRELVWPRFRAWVRGDVKDFLPIDEK